MVSESASSDSGFFSNPGQHKDVSLNTYPDLVNNITFDHLFVSVHSLTLLMWRCIRPYTPSSTASAASPTLLPICGSGLLVLLMLVSPTLRLRLVSHFNKKNDTSWN